MFDGMAVAIQKPPLSSDTNNWKLKKVMIVTASTVNTLKNQLLIIIYFHILLPIVY